LYSACYVTHSHTRITTKNNFFKYWHTIHKIIKKDKNNKCENMNQIYFFIITTLPFKRCLLLNIVFCFTILIIKSKCGLPYKNPTAIQSKIEFSFLYFVSSRTYRRRVTLLSNLSYYFAVCQKSTI